MMNKLMIEKALLLAHQAKSQGEVPVGAIIVYENQIIARGYNQAIASHDPTAHAEIVALRVAAKKLNNYRLLNTTLYITLEPCVMCFSALIHARIKKLVFGCADPKAGAISVFNLANHAGFNHRIEYEEGVLADECSQLLKDFFIQRRG